MKRKLFSVFAALVLVTVSVASMAITTAAAEISLSPSVESVAPGEEITLTTSLSAATTVSSGAVSVSYPADILELVGGDWLVEAAIEDLDVTTAKGVFVFETATEISGNVLTLTFKVLETAPSGEATVSCDLQLVNGNDTTALTAEHAVTVETVDPSTHKMNKISTVYQYIGGADDSSALKDHGKPNSSVYLYNGTQRTAFRVAATYQTDSPDFSTIVLDGKSYPILERGIILGTAGYEDYMTVGSGLPVVSRTREQGFASKYWEYVEGEDGNPGTVTYTALVHGITLENKDAAFIARSYVKIEANGTEYTIYSDVSNTFTPQQLYTKTAKAFMEQGITIPQWFTVDDGGVDFSGQ